MSAILTDFTGSRRDMDTYSGRLVRFDADARSSRAIRKVVSDNATQAGFDPDALADLLLAVGEAFTNAIRHGDACKEGGVTAEIIASPVEVTVILEYAGKSFCHKIPCLSEAVNLSGGGLGRMIMYSVLDEVNYEFRNGYTIVRMVKRASVKPSQNSTPM